MGKPRTPKGRAVEVARRLAIAYPDAECELDHTNAFELLAATILSAQTTDARVNMVTPELFGRYPTPGDLAGANPADVEEIIRSTGFYQNKTRSLIGMAQGLLERFDGEVPTDLDDLVTLPGVGPQDRQRRAQRGVRPPRPAGRHPRRPAVEASRASATLDDPVKLELQLNSLPATIRVGRVQSADDPSRSAGVRCEEAAMRRMHARGHLSVVAAPAPNVTKVAGCSLSVAACAESDSEYSDPYQPGSRHLVCGRCRDPPPGIAV